MHKRSGALYQGGKWCLPCADYHGRPAQWQRLAHASWQRHAIINRTASETCIADSTLHNSQHKQTATHKHRHALMADHQQSASHHVTDRRPGINLIYMFYLTIVLSRDAPTHTGTGKPTYQKPACIFLVAAGPPMKQSSRSAVHCTHHSINRKPG